MSQLKKFFEKIAVAALGAGDSRELAFIRGAEDYFKRADAVSAYYPGREKTAVTGLFVNPRIAAGVEQRLSQPGAIAASRTTESLENIARMAAARRERFPATGARTPEALFARHGVRNARSAGQLAIDLLSRHVPPALEGRITPEMAHRIARIADRGAVEKARFTLSAPWPSE